MAKIVFSCVVFFENRPPAKYRRVTNLPNLWQYCENNLGIITSINVYNKKTREFIKQFRSYSACFELFKMF